MLFQTTMTGRVKSIGIQFKACVYIYVLLCASVSHAGDHAIVSSIQPLHFIVKDLVGGEFSTESLLSPTVSPHHYALRVSDTRKLKESRLFLWVGPQLESFLAKAVDKYVGNAIELGTLSQFGLGDEHAVDTEGGHHPHSHAHESAGHASNEDAHIWLSYLNAKMIAKEIHRALVDLDPSRERVLDSRLDAFLALMDVEYQRAEREFLALDGIGFGVYHDGYSAFVSEHSLNQMAFLTLMPDEQMSLKRLLAVRRKLDGASCLLAEQSDSGRATRVAKKLDLSLVAVDLLGANIDVKADGQNFMRYMRSIRSSFKSCMMK